MSVKALLAISIWCFVTYQPQITEAFGPSANTLWIMSRLQANRYMEQAREQALREQELELLEEEKLKERAAREAVEEEPEFVPPQAHYYWRGMPTKLQANRFGK